MKITEPIYKCNFNKMLERFATIDTTYPKNNTSKNYIDYEMMIRFDDDTMSDIKPSTNFKLNTKLVFILMELNHIVNNKLDKFADRRITCLQKLQSNPMGVNQELADE